MDRTVEEVWDILSRPKDLPRWWPSVYLSVTPAPDHTFRFHTRGWLPDTLRWRAMRYEVRKPHGFCVEAQGDLTGTGRWTFTGEGPVTNIRYEWKVSADQWILRRLSWLLKPLFAANHRWRWLAGRKAYGRNWRAAGNSGNRQTAGA